jgi:hypothetical protein
MADGVGEEPSDPTAFGREKGQKRLAVSQSRWLEDIVHAEQRQQSDEPGLGRRCLGQADDPPSPG